MSLFSVSHEGNRPLGPAQIFQAKKEALYNRASRYFSSQPTANLVLTAMRAFPYVSEASSSAWYDVFAMRVAFFETACMASISLALNFFLAAASTFLSVVALGQVRAFNEAFKRNWLHTALALQATVLGFLGAIFPSLAVKGAMFTMGKVLGSFQSQILDLDPKEELKITGNLLGQLHTFLKNDPKLLDPDVVFEAFVKNVMPRFGDLADVLPPAVEALPEAPAAISSGDKPPV